MRRDKRIRHWYVSQVINQKFGNNFKAFLNGYRIKEACRRLNNVELSRNYTIETIAEGLGFKSRSYFITLFKKSVGITPSNYQRIALERAGKGNGA
ncbi:helix-turn-helix domain-containing protein [Prevotella dentasini]|uniref:helix-turn-helix domain-containing protein n=1 Tax=Prevotella dentasini TaxID=589537 RepID=UPI000467F014|nr:AraC family transcriptional regulator [Prevotella dentasini]